MDESCLTYGCVMSHKAYTDGRDGAGKPITIRIVIQRHESDTLTSHVSHTDSRGGASTPNTNAIFIQRRQLAVHV